MSGSPNDHTTSGAAHLAWPDALDALVAAPDHHTLLFENDRVRVLDTRISGGDHTSVHTHRWPAALYVISWSDFVRYDDTGKVVLDSRSVPALQNPPPAFWSEPLPPHSLQTVGAETLRIISVEVKT
jgi:hypothetical protein